MDGIFEFFGLAGRIYELMGEYTSADKVYRALREEGVAVSRAAVRTTWREIGLKTGWGRVAETWGLDRPLPKAWEMEGPAGMTTEYQFRFLAWGTDPATGKRVIQGITIQSDRPVGAGEYRDYAYEILDQYLEDLGIAIEGFTFAGVWHKP